MAGHAALPKTVFPYYRQTKKWSLVVGLVGLGVTMGNMFVPKPAALDNGVGQPAQSPPSSSQSPWDKQLVPSSTARTTAPKQPPKNSSPFTGNGSGPFSGGGNSTATNSPFTGNGSGPFGN